MISKTTTRKPTEPKIDVKMDITILSTIDFGTKLVLHLIRTIWNRNKIFIFSIQNSIENQQKTISYTSNFASGYNTNRDRKIKQAIIRKEEIIMEKTIVIEGMMCPHCSGRVQQALDANEAIANAVVSHETGTAVVTLAAEISDEALAQIVTDAGYKVVEVK